MPFEPQILRDDEPTPLEFPDVLAMLELPEELAMLGEQLSDDANRLACLYPAAASSPSVLPLPTAAVQIAAPSAVGRAVLRSVTVRRSAVAMLVGVATIAGVCLSPAGRPLNEQAERRFHLAVDHPQSSLGLNRPDAELSPATLFSDLTGPEREGLLDLMEEDQAFPQSRISI